MVKSSTDPNNVAKKGGPCQIVKWNPKAREPTVSLP